jgi:hypothetical protein
MQITCTKCLHPKDRADFYPSKNKSGITSACKSCIDARHYERRRERRIEQGLVIKFPTLAARKLLEEGKKYCPTCKEVKDLSEFSTMKVRGGIGSHCKSCTSTWSQEYNQTPKGKSKKKASYEKNKKILKNQQLIKDFGITLKEYELKLKNQNGGCAICKRTPKQNKKMLAVDHCHVTGKNRGLLCSSCNILLGFIEKNKLDFSSISGYLTKHGLSIN